MVRLTIFRRIWKGPTQRALFAARAYADSAAKRGKHLLLNIIV